MNSSQAQYNDSRTFECILIIMIALFSLAYFLHRYDGLIFESVQTIERYCLQLIPDINKSTLGQKLFNLLGIPCNDWIRSTDRLTNHLTNHCGITTHELIVIAQGISKIVLLPIFPVLVCMLYYAFKVNNKLTQPHKRFKHSQDIKDFFESCITFPKFTETELSNIYHGAHASSLTPRQYVEHHNIAKVDAKSGKIISIKTKDLEKNLKNQLEELFKGFNQLPVAFKNLITDLKLMIPDQYLEEATLAAEKHKFNTTVVVSYSYSAKSYGVVPMQYFNAIKKINRNLWYALMSIGRPSIFVEGAAIIEQYFYERSASTFLKKKKSAISVHQTQKAILEAILSESDERAWIR